MAPGGPATTTNTTAEGATPVNGAETAVAVTAAPTSAPTSTATAEPAPTPTTPTPQDPAEATPATQVAEVLRDVRRLADGSHRLSMQLYPEELGAVQLEVALRDGRLHLRAVAHTEAGRAALESSLPELRSELGDAGVDAGSLEVGSETADGRTFAQRETDDQADTARGGPTTGTPGGRPDPTTPTPSPGSTSTLVDVRL